MMGETGAIHTKDTWSQKDISNRFGYNAKTVGLVQDSRRIHKTPFKSSQNYYLKKIEIKLQRLKSDARRSAWSSDGRATEANKPTKTTR